MELKASLVDLGVMNFIATGLIIPASPYLGRLPDRYGKVKLFIIVSFMAVSLLIFLMSITTDAKIFQLLYVLMCIFKYVEDPATRILVAESFDQTRWVTVLSKLNFFASIAGVIGLAFCSLTVNIIGYKNLLILASFLTIISLFLAFITIQEPPVYFERMLGRLNRPINDVEALSFHITSEGSLVPAWKGRLKIGKEPRMTLLGLGRALFAFSASNALTSLPVYLLEKAGLLNSTIFTIFLIRGIFGAIGYLSSIKIVENGGRAVKIATGMRVILVSLIPVCAKLPKPLSILTIALLLSMISLSWSIYSIGLEIVTISYAPPGRLGVYDALTSLGNALGSFSSGFIPTIYGFNIMFGISSVLFAFSLLLFIFGLG
jgi:predicted MFS family arabinose efflux permease